MSRNQPQPSHSEARAPLEPVGVAQFASAQRQLAPDELEYCDLVEDELRWLRVLFGAESG